MKSAIGKMLFKDRIAPQVNKPWSDFEVHSISSDGVSYTGKKTDGTEFHCYQTYWKYEAYSCPRENSALPKAGSECLMNFYDRSGDNWTRVKILFVGTSVIVYQVDGREYSCKSRDQEFRALEEKK